MDGLLVFQTLFLGDTRDLNATLYPLIAPLWADYKPGAGVVLYRTVQDSSTLRKVADIIHELNHDLESFRPTYAVIVTWLQMQLMGRPTKEVSIIIMQNYTKPVDALKNAILSFFAMCVFR